MKIAEDHIQKTAFSTKFGYFEFTGMPFGLTNAPAEFMNMIDSLLHEYQRNFLRAYLDYIITYNETYEEQI